MEAILGALLIFVLRIGDVSIGTMRVLMVVQGRRMPATVLALVEAGIWILAISRVFSGAYDWHQMVGYACGFAAGTLIGMTIEQWIAHGKVLVRVVSRDDASTLHAALGANGFGATRFHGEGFGGNPVQELMVVTNRRLTKKLLRLIHEADPDAFITVTGVAQMIGGYLPQTRAWSLRK